MSASPITKRARIAEHAFLEPAKSSMICSSLEEASGKLKIGTHDGKVLIAPWRLRLERFLKDVLRAQTMREG